MAVAEQIPIITHVGNGVSTVFAYSFLVGDEDDMRARVAGVELELGDDFSISGVGSPGGGTVQFVVAPESGDTVVLYRSTVLRRDIDYQDNGDLLAETLNDDIDRGWLALQELKHVYQGATLRAPFGEELPELPDAATRAGYLQGYDSNGDPVVVAPTSGSAAALALDLVNSSTVSKGSGQIGWGALLQYAFQTIGWRMRQDDLNVFDYMSQSQWEDVVAGTALVDVATAVATAMNDAATRKKTLHFPGGNYLMASGIAGPGRFKGRGDGQQSTQFYYRPTLTTANQCIDFDNVDNVVLEDMGFVFLSGGGGQNSTGMLCQGDGGPVTEIRLNRVNFTGFQKYGLRLNTSAYYGELNGVRFDGCTNEVANGGTGTGNAVALSFGSVVNAVRVRDTRFASNDKAIDSDNADKNSLVLDGCYFEANGRASGVAEDDTIGLLKWRAVDIRGCYIEANLTGTGTANAALRLQSCRAVRITGGLLAGAIGGVQKSKNLISISDDCRSVSIDGVEFQDPISKYIYVADGTSIVSARRCTYMVGSTEQKTYQAIMALMTADLVEIDVPFLATINTGTVASGANYQVNITGADGLVGVPVDKNIVVKATPQGGGADFNWSTALIAADTVRIMADNIKGSNNSFNGTIPLLFEKHASF